MWGTRPLDGAESSLVGQGYAVVQRIATTLAVEREDSEGLAGEELTPKVVVMAVPHPRGATLRRGEGKG